MYEALSSDASQERITAARALQHAYFRADGKGYSCSQKVSGGGGSGGGAVVAEYEFEDEALANCK